MALRAQVAEDNLTAERVADMLAKIRRHFSHDLFALGISFFTNPAKRLLHSPERLTIVAFQNLAQVIRIEDAFGQLVGEHGIEKRPRPLLALHDEINRERL